jgi:hypothetical protein
VTRFLALLVLALSAAAAAAPAQPIVDAPVAVVFHEPIWQSELDERVSHLPQPHDAKAIDTALDALIDDTLVLRAARDLQITTSDHEVDQAVDVIKNQNHLDQAGFEKALADAHYTLAQYREDLRRQLILQRFLMQQLAPRLKPGTDVDTKVKQLEALRVDWTRAERQRSHLDRRPVATPAQPTGKLVAFDVRFPDRTIAEQAKQLLAEEVGKPLDRDKLRGALGNVFALPGVADVTVTSAPGKGGITLVLALTPQPKVHDVALREAGGSNITLPPDLTALIGKPFDPHTFDLAAQDMREHYLEHGYPDAVVEWRTTPVAGQVDVAVEATLGAQVTVDGFDFKGNAHVPSKALSDVAAKDFPPGTPWRADVVEHATLLLQAYYMDHGYPSIQIRPVAPGRGRVKLAFEITEGDLYHLGKIAITGLPAADATRELAKLALHKGDVFSRAQIVSAIEALKASTSASDVEPSTELDTPHKLLNLTLEVHK